MLISHSPVLGGEWALGSARDVRYVAPGIVALDYEDGHVAGRLVVRVVDATDLRTGEVLEERERSTGRRRTGADGQVLVPVLPRRSFVNRRPRAQGGSPCLREQHPIRALPPVGAMDGCCRPTSPTRRRRRRKAYSPNARVQRAPVVS